jgi:hypothetical protein
MLITVIAGAVTGFAASLNVASDQLGSGIAPVTSCDTDGVTATYDINLGLVVAVVVNGIADGSTTIGSGACDGEIVHVELLGSGGSAIVGATGSTTNTGDINSLDNTVVVALATPTSAALVTGVRITITG